MRKSAEDLSSQGPIYLGYRLGHLQSDGRIFRAIVYNKAAVVLHMLRRLVGDDVFFASLRDFYSSRRFRKAGTDDLREVFEARSGRSLERFFERWIHNAELPELRISSSLDSAGRVAKVRVQQLGEVFDIPIPVLVQYQDGKSEEIQVIAADADREYEIELKSPARRIDVREEQLMMIR
jgi:aminopeptidase N